MKRVCVFCGSSPGIREDYGNAARRLAVELARRGVELVYGGGNIGLMGQLADAMLQAGGKVIGVIPKLLVGKELAHSGATTMHIVDTMHQRKALMNELSDAFIALPGGFGTLEEFFEVLTWSQLGLHGKPCGLLNVAGYYDHLLAMLDHAAREQFVRPAQRALVMAHTDAVTLLEHLYASAAILASKSAGVAGNFP